MTPEQFWEASPREVARAFEAARLRSIDRHDRDVSQAWSAVSIYFHAVGKKRLPTLKSLLLGKRKAKPKDQLRASRGPMLAFAAAHNKREARKRRSKGSKKADV